MLYIYYHQSPHYPHKEQIDQMIFYHFQQFQPQNYDTIIQ